MKIKTEMKARKQPRQKRSRETVEAILTATTHVLVEEGFSRATTNRIAERAGVSIGSLYQYFPNKQALIVALIKRHNSEIIDIVRSEFDSMQNESLAGAGEALVNAAFEAYRVNPALHKILVEQIPNVGEFQHEMNAEREITEILCSYFQKHPGELRPNNPRLAAFIAVHTVKALTHAAASANRHTNFHGTVEIKREISDILLRYLVLNSQQSQSE